MASKSHSVRNVREMCRDYDKNEAEARRVLALPSGIYEAVRKGATYGDEMADFAILRNKAYDAVMIRMYQGLRKKIAANIGSPVLVRAVSERQRKWPHDDSPWRETGNNFDMQIIDRAGIISSGLKIVPSRHGNELQIPVQGGHLEWRMIRRQQPTLTQAGKIPFDLPLDDYRGFNHGAAEGQPASALMGELVTEPTPETPDLYRTSYLTRVALSTVVYVGAEAEGMLATRGIASTEQLAELTAPLPV